MPESYVRPVTAAREPKPEWHAVWRYRAVMAALLIAVASGGAWGFNQLLHLGDQNPASDVPPPSPSP